MSRIIGGPFRVYWDTQDMGYSESDIELNDEPQFVEAKVTEFGDSVFNEMTNGSACTITVPFTEMSNTVFAKLGGTEVGTDVIFSCPVGTLVRTLAKELILKPVVDQVVSVDSKEWTTVYVTYPKRKFATTYGPSQRVWNVEFQAYPSLVSGQKGYFYKLGENA